MPPRRIDTTCTSPTLSSLMCALRVRRSTSGAERGWSASRSASEVPVDIIGKVRRACERAVLGGTHAVRAAAVRALAELASPLAADEQHEKSGRASPPLGAVRHTLSAVLRARLGDTAAGVRAAAVEAVGALGVEGQHEDVLRALASGDADPQVRELADVLSRRLGIR